MDVQSLRVLMEINALQSLGAVQNAQTNQQQNSSLFSSILGDVLSQSSTSFGYANMANALLYNGVNDVFLPPSLQQVQQNQLLKPLQEASSNIADKGKYAPLIQEAAATYQLPERLISSVIQHESNFNNFTESKAGAQGLMQLMPGTARFLGVTDSFDPRQNILGGAKYLRQMLDQFNGDIKLALAAYNAGPGNVKKYAGIPPFKETQNYVKKVLNSMHA